MAITDTTILRSVFQPDFWPEFCARFLPEFFARILRSVFQPDFLPEFLLEFFLNKFWN